jgi:hypothetical protein
VVAAGVGVSVDCVKSVALAVSWSALQMAIRTVNCVAAAALWAAPVLADSDLVVERTVGSYQQGWRLSTRTKEAYS